MSSQPVQSYLVIAAAIVIAGVLISASLFVAIGGTKTTTVTSTVTTTSTATCTSGGSNATNSFTTNCNLGITLSVGIRPDVLVGRNETVSVSLTNNLPDPTAFVYTGLPILPKGPLLSSVAATVDMYPPPPVCGYPSVGNYVPAYIVVYNGAGVPVQLTDSAIATVSCLHGTGDSLTLNASQTATEVLSIGGVWTSTDANQPWINATYSHFSPGNYTVVAFDAVGPARRAELLGRPQSQRRLSDRLDHLHRTGRLRAVFWWEHAKQHSVLLQLRRRCRDTSGVHAEGDLRRSSCGQPCRRAT